MKMILNLNILRSCFMLTLFINLSRSFLPNQNVNFLSGNDYTHADITEIGTLKAVAEYFEHNPLPGKKVISPGTLTGIPDITARKLFDGYYGGSVSERRFQTAVDDIIKYNNKVDKDHFDKAYWHCSGEQISEGHTKMQILREELLQNLNSSSPDYDTAREVIGQYLHILQMFYSNTNWIELYGGKIYSDLGMTGKPIMATSKDIPITCKSCSSKSVMDCFDNLEPIGDVLTSGYKDGQDIPSSNGFDIKIVDNHESSESEKHGKCSHGGPQTSVKSSAATGGINKDTLNPTYSPHFILHKTAALAAIEHTKYFFIDPTNGLNALIGDEKFEDLLQLQPGKSLIFVIDTTRSISEDVISIIDTTKQSTTEKHLHQPYNYILVSSNSQSNKTDLQVSKHDYEIVTWLNNMKFRDGHGCSEFSLAGIQTAAAAADPTSKIYVFTDSPPKDLERMNSIISLITEKRLQVEFLITDQCVKRNKRAASDNLLKTHVTSYPNPVLLNKEQHNGILVLKKTIHNDETNLLQIPVDTTMTELEIRIQGDKSMPNLYIQGPQGDPVFSNGKKVLQNLYYGNYKTYTIQNPEAGLWTIYKLDRSTWNIEVTGQSNIDFTYEFLEKDQTDEQSLEQIVLIYLKSNENVDVVERIVLVDEQGNEILQSKLKTASDGVFESHFPIPHQNFSIAIYGRDVFGIRFRRTKVVMHKHVHRRDADKSLRVARATPIFWKGINIYQQIAQTSGGNVYSLTKPSISTAINVIQNSTVSSDVTIIREVLDYKVGTCETFSFYIDDTVTEFTLRINGEQGLPSPIIKNPNFTYVLPGKSPNTTRNLIGGRFVVETFKYPDVGKWTVKKLDRYDWNVELTAQSSVDFTYKFLELGPGGASQFEITGRPVAGLNTSVVVRVKEYAKVTSIDELLLMNKYGQIIANATLSQKQGNRTQGLYTGSLIMPDNEFQVAIIGLDKKRYPFQRLHTTLISTVAVTLEKLHINGPFYTNERFIIPFRVTNIGSGYTTVDVDITDDQGFAQTPTNLTFDIPGGANVTGSFVLTANTAGKTATITISARPRGAKGTKFQYLIIRETTHNRTSKKVDNFSPVCKVLKTAGSCSWDVCKCNDTRLETEAEVWDYGFGLKTVTTSGAGSDAKFTHDKFSVGDIRNISGVVNVRLIVSCCRKETFIKVTDVSGRHGECKIEVNKEYKKDGCKKEEKSDSGNLNTAVVAGVGAGAGAVVIASVVTSVVIVKKKLAANSATAVTPLM